VQPAWNDTAIHLTIKYGGMWPESLPYPERRTQAVALIQKRAASEPSLERITELEALARQVAVVSPHKLRHGLAYRLWKTATPAAIMHILGHSRVSTTLKYGQPTDDDLRAALEDASRVR
jgi:integrase